jgi:hypothetical protein
VHSEKMTLKWSSLGSPRRDGAALGFGLAFLVFGSAGLIRGVGVDVHATWLYPLVLVALGAAGLISLLLHERR